MALKHHAAPQFFWIWKPPGEGAPPTPLGGRRFCHSTTHGCNPRFSTQAPPALSGCSGPGGQNGASQPRNVVGEGLGWVEHSHPKSPNIIEPHRLHFSGCTLPMFHTPRRARRPNQHQPAPRRPTQGRKSFAGPFHTKLWREHDFGGTSPRFGS